MYSKRGFLRKLRKLIATDELNSSQHTLLVTSIDWYSGIRRRSGESASRRLAAAAARSLKRAAGENVVAAYFGDGCFATLHVGQSPAAAKSIAEHFAKDFGSSESQRETIPRPTLTSAVVPWTAGLAPDRLVNDALETLALARQSGGDCVLQHGDFAKELATWQYEMSAGNPFENVVAQDIMEPFPALLLCDTDQTAMADALRRSGVPVCPYVDRQGRLVRVETNADAKSDATAGEPNRVPNSPHSAPDTISHDASFPEIYEAFSSRGCSTLVVTAGDHPLGYLTCDGFLSMIDPINSASFANGSEPTDDMSFLVVPSTVGGAVAAEAVGV
jgi:GGDEF domain-containing protein